MGKQHVAHEIHGYPFPLHTRVIPSLPPVLVVTSGHVGLGVMKDVRSTPNC